MEVGEAAFEEWIDLTKCYAATIIIGFTEREGDNLYDSAAVFEKGKLLSRASPGIQRD